MLRTLSYLLVSMRPKQWVKNIIVYAGIVFAQKLFDMPYFLKVSYSFILFCFVSSCIYLINDLKDQENDKLHPIKRERPIASGRISSSIIFGFLILVLPLCISLSFWLNFSFGLILLAYIAMMMGYIFGLKEIVLLDAFIIAAGYVLRGIAGIEVVGIQMSPWFLICASLIALFIVFCKRRHEILILKDNAVAHRKVLSEYNTSFLDQLISIISSAIIVTYILYTLAPETVLKFQTKGLLLTAPFVVFGLFQFLWFVYKKDDGGNAEDIIIKSPIMLFVIIGWFIVTILVLYGKIFKMV